MFRIFVALSLTESLQIQVEWKQHMCFVHAHHGNTNFKFLTISLFHFSFQQASRWAWNKLNMHLKLYYFPKAFSNWISSHNLCTWLAENISRYSSFCLHIQAHAVSCWRKWFLFLTNSFFEFVHMSRSSHGDLFRKNIKLFMNLEF